MGYLYPIVEEINPDKENEILTIVKFIRLNIVIRKIYLAFDFWLVFIWKIITWKIVNES